MGGISQYLAVELLDHLLGEAAYTAPATLYLGMHNVGHGNTPLTEADLTGTEVVVTGYARQTITFNGAKYLQFNGAFSDSSSAPTFTAGAGSEVTDAWGLYDASTGGNLLFWGEVGDLDAVIDTGGYTIPAGDIACSLTGGLSQYAAWKLLDLVLTNTAFTVPTTHHVGLHNVPLSKYTFQPEEPESFLNFSEIANVDYARQSIGFAAAANSGVGGSIATNVAAAFATATVSWDSPTKFVIYDALTGGNRLYHGPMDFYASPLIGQNLNFASGALVATLGPAGGV